VTVPEPQGHHQFIEETTMEYESPEIIASYSEDELVAEAAVAMEYGNNVIILD
jgi:hypothetical protein